MTKRLPLRLEHICERPKAPDGFAFVTATISAGGEALFLFIEKDGAQEVHAQEHSGIGIFPKPQMPTPRAFRLYIIGGDGTRFIDIPPLDIAFPHVELFPDGRVLLAAARCSWRGPDDFDKNGAIFDPKSGRLDRILLGDGIADLAIDGAGRIWAAYFDEGVFGNFGWGYPGPPGPGAGGLVCFDASGAMCWRFNSEDAASFIDDCYALHASRELISVFFYSSFQVCEVDMNFASLLFAPRQIAGSQSLVASKAALLFGCQYNEAADSMHLVMRRGEELDAPRPVLVQLSDGRAIEAGRLIGRGERLHYLDESGWFRADLATLVAAAT